MNIRDLVSGLKDVLKNSTAITDYCMNNFAKHQTVIVGMDSKESPKVDKMPCFIVFIIISDRTTEQLTYNISIGISIEDNTIITNELNYEEYSGFIHVIQLKELIETELYKKYGKILFKSTNIPNDVFPVFSAEVNAILPVPISKRSCREPL